MDKLDKKRISNLLIDLKVVTQATTGQVVIHFNDGSVVKVVKTVEVK